MALSRLAVLGAKLEHMSDFDRALHFQRFAAGMTRFAGLHEPQIRPVPRMNVAPHRHVAAGESRLRWPR